MGTIRKRRSSLLSFKLTSGLTDRKDETSDKAAYTNNGQKKEGNVNFCFSRMSMMIQKMREKERNIWLRLMETIENSR